MELAEELEFKWGKKRRTGGKKKDVQFYESFTYDGDEYCLYDCVLVEDSRQPDSGELFVGKIIKIWEHSNKRAKFPRQVKLLWFFKPSEVSSCLEDVPGVLANELFLASGEGVGLANISPLEAIGGKCSVICISKDERNPQPSDEEIKSAHFVFRRAFDVGSCKVLDTIGDNIAGVDVKYIFNKTGCKKEAPAVLKIEAGSNGNLDNLKPNGPSASGLVRKTEDNSIESSDYKERSDGCKEEKENCHNQLATKKSPVAEERSKIDAVVNEDTRNERDTCEASGSKGNDCDAAKAQEKEVQRQFTKQKSMPAEERYKNSCEAAGSRINHSDSKTDQVNGVKKQLTKQKSFPEQQRYSKESNGLDDRPQKKQKIDGSDGKKDTGFFRRPKDKVPGGEVLPEKPNVVTKEDLGVSISEGKYTKTNIVKKENLEVSLSEGKDTKTNVVKKEDLGVSISEGKDTKPNVVKKEGFGVSISEGKDTKPNIVKKQDLGVSISEGKFMKPNVVKKQDFGVSISEGKDTKTATEKVLTKKPSVDGKLIKPAGDKRLSDGNERNYQVTEVTQKPNVVNNKWFRPLPWEESMREAETDERLVLLQNLNPSYTSHEVQDIVYSALNEQCTARMIERIPVFTPHIGQALVIFESREAALRVVRRVDKGCLLLSDGRPLVASFANINPPGKPSSSFPGHIKLQSKFPMRRETREAKATAHCSQGNTLEYELAMEWCLHQARTKDSTETVFKRQLEEKKSMRINFKPKLP